MNSTIQQLAIGCVLGDGYITPSGCLQIEQSIKQKDYLDWKYKQFQEVVKSGPRQISRYDRRTGRKYTSYRFYTKSIFKYLRSLFYPINKKIIPSNIGEYLTSNLALAILYMDDGGRGGNTKKGMIISLTGYNIEGRELLQSTIQTNYGIQVNLHKNGQLYVPAKSYHAFYKCVSPHIIPCMQYKLPVTP